VAPRGGPLPFTAADLPDIGGALATWFDLWHRSFPALGLLRETIEQGLEYSAPRFLTRYTAAEAYWRNVKTAQWRPKALADCAGISPAITKATEAAIALIGDTRRYHAHLGKPMKFTVEEIVGSTYQSTRRLHVLLQACVMRELGVGTEAIERLMRAHYRFWPMP
jgi:hypothetical protein